MKTPHAATLSAIAICLLALACSLASAAEPGALEIVRAGHSDYTIVLTAQASPSEQHAAAELQRFIAEMSGARLPIVIEDAAPLPKMIVVGYGESLRHLKPRIPFRDLGDEGFAIKTVGPHLVIAGGRLRGTMYGVYSFLEEVLGCRWYTAKVSVIPRRPTITVPPLAITQKPDFRYRDPSFTEVWDKDWAARNKANGIHFKLDAERGGSYEFGHWVHSFWELVPAKEYAADHPEYFALVGGKRTPAYDAAGPQLCLTNPEVLSISLRTVLGWIEAHPERKDYFVAENDTGGWCECEDCKAVYAEEGGQAGLLLRFVNAIADAVGKEHPDVTLHTLAYLQTESPPKVTRPRPKVAIWLGPISNCQYHPYATCDFPDGARVGFMDNPGFMQTLRGWDEISDNLYIWHYAFVFYHTLLPLPDFEQLAANIPMYRQHGVQGIHMQGCGTTSGGGFMSELKAYLVAKLLWNSSADPRAIQTDFLRGFYGKAGRPIGRWLDLMQAEIRRRDLHGSCHPEWDAAWYLHRDQVFDWPKPYLPLMTPEVIAASDRLLDTAERDADTPETLDRVKRARLCLKYVKVMREVEAASTADATPAARATALTNLEGWVSECEAHDIHEISLVGNIRESCAKIAVPLRKPQ